MPTIWLTILIIINTAGLILSVLLCWHIIWRDNKPKLTTIKNISTNQSNKPQPEFSLIDFPTRHDLVRKLHELTMAAKTENLRIIMFLLDLDNFNTINEEFGLTIGDLVLQQVADRIKTDMQDNCLMISYMGGDEYAIVMTGNMHTTTHELEKKADYLQYVICKPYNIMGHEIYTSVSIGICIYPDHAANAEQLISCSAVARSDAKKLGKHTHSFYELDINNKAAETSKLGQELHLAIEREELFLVYQPKIDVQTGLVTSSEALIRWRHPERGIVNPDVFIPIAENIGMIAQIGDWIISMALEDLRRLHLSGLNTISVAVNLSAAQFSKGDVVSVIANALCETRLAPNFLEVELTESMVMNNPIKSLLMLRVLNSMGIKIAMDDFGTGYSSLSHLRTFPIDIIKIDQSFVKGMSQDENNHAIVSTIIVMSKKLGLKVVAEGVDSAAEVKILQEEGCDYIQGYYYSKPLEYADFKQYCEENRRNNNRNLTTEHPQ